MIQLPISTRQWLITAVASFNVSLQPTMQLSLPLTRNQASIMRQDYLQQVQGRQGTKLVGRLAIKKKAILAEAHESVKFDKEQLAFLADLGIPNGQAAQTTILNNAAFQIGDLDSYDSDCDDVSNAKVVLMANLSNYGFDVISEVSHSKPYHNDMDNQSYQNPFYLKKAHRIKPTLNDGIVISAKHVAMPVIDDEETLILEEESRSKILSEDFGKRFTPQQEFLAKQVFYLRMSIPTSKSSDASPVKIEAPKELPKVSLVNESLKKLKFHLARFDNVVKIRTTHDARTEGEWGFEHAKVVFNKEIIPFLKSLKDIFNVFDKNLLNEIMEVQTVFDQMDADVQRSSVDKQCLEIAKKELLLENDQLSQQIMFSICSLNDKSVNVERKQNESCDKCFNLDAEL
ncbi:hypothetical protein Tco_0438776 [Tanacetum coccineum]